MRSHRTKGVVILGSTGSIGMNTLRVIRALAPRFRIVGLSTNRRVERLARQAREYHPLAVVVSDAAAYAKRPAMPRLSVWQGREGLVKLATMPEADIVVCAMSGGVGLVPTLQAILAAKRVAIANKEPLVMAGELMMEASRRSGAMVLPIDSEHSALFQCLYGNAFRAAARDTRGGIPRRKGLELDGVKRLILTASGGPFRATRRLDAVTVAQALRHPTWRMGPKITVDSATLMNKGLEVIEAHWLFGVPLDAIDVLIHPQSVIHSMVEYRDGSVVAQLSITDMRLPIQYALCYPDRVSMPDGHLNFASLPPLTFEHPRHHQFPSLKLAYRAAEVGGTMPAVLNGANEEAVSAFLASACQFVDIPKVIERTMRAHRPVQRPGLEQILEADTWARAHARRVIETVLAKRTEGSVSPRGPQARSRGPRSGDTPSGRGHGTAC